MTANDRPQVTKKGHEHGNTGQSGGLKLMTGVGPQHTSATKIWFGGRARVYFGKDFQEYIDLSEGDFMFVPPLEVNMSTTEELWWLACRTPENIVVNLPDVEDSSLVGYRRA
jgi:hypothetical protein